MSYLITRTHLSLEMDILTPYNVDSNYLWLFTAPTTFNTDISVSGNTITLYSGSSYYIEAGINFRYGSSTGEGSLSFQLYDSTNSTLIGQSAYARVEPSVGFATLQGRQCARALILGSDISGTSLNVQLKRTAQTGTLSAFQHDLEQNLYSGYPSVRIWQLPS